MVKKRRKRKNCPECQYWWFNRRSHGCLKDNDRFTYTSLTLPIETKDREWCLDMKKRKKV